MWSPRESGAMGANEVETEQTTVKTRVPAYQKAEWREHAEDLDMSQSEFVRTMVQAGRRGFEGVGGDDPEETGDDDTDPRGRALEDRVRAVLDEQGELSFDELVAELTADVEDRVAEVVRASDEFSHDPRHNAYRLDDE